MYNGGKSFSFFSGHRLIKIENMKLMTVRQFWWCLFYRFRLGDGNVGSLDGKQNIKIIIIIKREEEEEESERK